LEQSKNVPQEVVTFHSGEQNELEDVTKYTKSKIIQPTRNHPAKLRHIKTEPKTPWESMWDLIGKKTIWYHEIIAISPHVRKSKIE
jgi:hypothetical protein